MEKQHTSKLPIIKRHKKSKPTSLFLPSNLPYELQPTPSSSSSSSSSSISMSIITTPSSSSSSSTIVDLPCSILMDILSRLQIKTLIQCSFVCKSWRSLLSESYLYKLYCIHTPTTLILQVKGSNLEILKEVLLIENTLICSPSLTRKMRLISSRDIWVKGRRKLDDEGDWIVPNFRYQLGNGCNGLVCLREIRNREPRLIWNPVMGQFVVLPNPGSVSIEKVVAGFGYCNRSNRYKVIRIFDKQLVQIYDVGVGCKWREIGESPFAIPSRIPGFYTNGCLHWIIGQFPGLICCFDFVDEVFRIVPDPPIYNSTQKKKYHWSNLGILGGGCLSICAIDAKIFRPDVQVWVMQEYGVAESWALRLSIRDPTVDWWDPYRWIQVTNFLRNGEILMLCGHCYVLAYNVKERRFRNIEGLDFPAIAHVPSFISLEDVLRDDLGTGSLVVRYL